MAVVLLSATCTTSGASTTGETVTSSATVERPELPRGSFCNRSMPFVCWHIAPESRTMTLFRHGKMTTAFQNVRIEPGQGDWDYQSEDLDGAFVKIRVRGPTLLALRSSEERGDVYVPFDLEGFDPPPRDP